MGSFDVKLSILLGLLAVLLALASVGVSVSVLETAFVLLAASVGPTEFGTAVVAVLLAAASFVAGTAQPALSQFEEEKQVQ